MTRSTASGRPGGHATENGGLGSRFSLTDEGRSGGMQTLEGPSQGRGIFAGAKTGYVVLRIEPRSASRPLRASSAFPTLTGSMPLAAGLQARQRAIRPPQAAIQGRPIPARGPGLPKIHPRPVGGLWTNRPTVTLGGRSLTIGGQSTPAHCRHLRGKRQFSAWPGLAKCLQALAAVKLCTGTVHKPVEKPDFYRHLRGATLDTWGAASLTLGGPATDI